MAAEPELYADFDIDDWEPIEIEPQGTKFKLWMAEPGVDGAKWVWKPRTRNPAPGGGTYWKGDDWSEKVATELAFLLHVPTPRVELAQKGDELGIVVDDFIRGRQAHFGNELLPSVIRFYEAGQREEDEYTVGSVQEALQEVLPPVSEGTLPTAFDWFVGYLVLDAWIGNVDRHHENWATLDTGLGPRLAASYDHASCLGYLLSDEERGKRLGTTDANYTIEAFADRARSKFDGRPHPRVVALEGLGVCARGVAATWLHRLSDSLPLATHVLSRVPSSRMTDVAKLFAIRLLEHNGTALLAEAHGTLSA